jgi:hypothetical protein
MATSNGRATPKEKSMRLSVIAALLSVGFFAGCGGVELEEREVTAQAPPPCERACLMAYNRCINNATTAEQRQVCEDQSTECHERCEIYPAPAPQVEAMRPPPCEYACDLAYTFCMRNATTQAQRDACGAEQSDCYGMCPAPPVSAQALPPCERACVTVYNRCRLNAATPEQLQACDDRLNLCTESCQVNPILR